MVRSFVVLAVLSLSALASQATAQTPDIHEGSSGDLISRARILKEAAVTRSKLAARVNFDGISNPKTSLADALALFEKRCAIPIDINASAFEDEGVSDVLSRPIGKAVPKMRGVPVSTLLCSILGRIPSRSGVTFFPRCSVVEISTVRSYRYELRLTGAIVRPAPPIVPGSRR